MPSLTTIGLALAGFFVAALLLLHWGDAYGPNAQKYAAVAAQLAAKNAELTRQLEEDANQYAAETADAANRAAEFKKTLPTLSSCKLDQADVDALNELIGD